MHNKRVENFEPRFPRTTAPYRAFFTWEIHYDCNYNCSYCHAPKPWHPNVWKATYLDVKEWIRIWDRVYEDYGCCRIFVGGGEPFIYPSFMDLVIGLSNAHFLEICTNLSWDVGLFIKKVNPKDVKVETSFHPEFADLNKFLEKIRLLKESGFETMVNFVAWPPFLHKMQEFREKVEEIGTQFVLQPFTGKYNRRRYPQGYTKSGKEYFRIFKDENNVRSLNFRTTDKLNQNKGKFCRMGQNYAFIRANGDAYRCCRDDNFSLGNLVEGTFKLLSEHKPCVADYCNCWRCMLVGKEDEWSRHWQTIDISTKDPQIKVKETIKHQIYLDGVDKANNKSMLKVALVQCPAWGVFNPPIGLAQLSGYLKQRGYTVKVIDVNIGLYNSRKEEYKTVWAIEQSNFWFNMNNITDFFLANHKSIEEHINKILYFNPDVIGFSVSTTSLLPTLEFAKRIKKINPKIKIVIGGPMFFVPTDIKSILQNGCADIIVLGEGEEKFHQLLEVLEKKKDLNLCCGIYFRRNGRVIKTRPRPLLKNLDQLPFLDFTDLPFNEYDPPGHLGKHIPLMTSRGCPLNCVFCASKIYWPGYRTMSGKRIYDEIKYHIERNPDIGHIEFMDLLFNGNMRVLNEFCDLMIASSPKPGLHWDIRAIIRPEMTLEVFQKMKEAGCRHIYYGIESGSQRVLGLMRKPYKIGVADRLLQYTHDTGIRTTCNFMFGFPGETEEDFQMTLDFLKRNAKYIDTAYPSRAYCTIEPHTYLEKHMEEFGIVPPKINTYWESNDGRNNYPERLRRCEVFSELASSIRVSVGLGLQTSIELDKCYNLGHYYESKNDYRKATLYFLQYLKLDPGNKMISDKVNRLNNFCSDIPPQPARQISFDWDIHWVCNYRCPYCWFYGKWVDLKGHNVYIPIGQLLKFWEDVYLKYGEVCLAIVGGEPLLYPGFAELIKELSQLHKIEIVTNLSMDIGGLINKIDLKNTEIHPSFHPLFADFDRFVKKVLALKEKGLTKGVSYLAWPPQIKSLEFYRDRFLQYGITMFIQSFFGEYRGIRYPAGYTDDEKETILPYLGSRGGKPFQTESITTRGKMCAAGHRYAVIHPPGKILRCGGLNSSEPDKLIIGNLLDENFRLLEEPSPCTSEICPCNEWAFLLEGE